MGAVLRSPQNPGSTNPRYSRNLKPCLVAVPRLGALHHPHAPGQSRKGRSKPWKYHRLPHGSVSLVSIEPGAASLSTEDEIPAERSQVRARALPAAQGLPLHMPHESSRRYQSHYKPNGCLIASAPISLKPDQHSALNSSTCKS